MTRRIRFFCKLTDWKCLLVFSYHRLQRAQRVQMEYSGRRSCLESSPQQVLRIRNPGFPELGSHDTVARPFTCSLCGFDHERRPPQTSVAEMIFSTADGCLGHANGFSQELLQILYCILIILEVHHECVAQKTAWFSHKLAISLRISLYNPFVRTAPSTHTFQLHAQTLLMTILRTGFSCSLFFGQVGLFSNLAPTRTEAHTRTKRQR
jgi:hypothetical protein